MDGLFSGKSEDDWRFVWLMRQNCRNKPKKSKKDIFLDDFFWEKEPDEFYLREDDPRLR